MTRDDENKTRKNASIPRSYPLPTCWVGEGKALERLDELPRLEELQQRENGHVQQHIRCGPPRRRVQRHKHTHTPYGVYT